MASRISGLPQCDDRRQRQPLQGAATSGAGTAFTVALYGTDQYIIQYDYEIGPLSDPKAWETYQRISYPFLHADRIKTATPEAAPHYVGNTRRFLLRRFGGSPWSKGVAQRAASRAS